MTGCQEKVRAQHQLPEGEKQPVSRDLVDVNQAVNQSVDQAWFAPAAAEPPPLEWWRPPAAAAALLPQLAV